MVDRYIDTVEYFAGLLGLFLGIFYRMNVKSLFHRYIILYVKDI